MSLQLQMPFTWHGGRCLISLKATDQSRFYNHATISFTEIYKLTNGSLGLEIWQIFAGGNLP